jgi:hypothetical protein
MGYFENNKKIISILEYFLLFVTGKLSSVPVANKHNQQASSQISRKEEENFGILHSRINS